MAIGGPAAILDRQHQFGQDFLALATHDHIDPRRLGQDLLEHEGGMNAAHHPKGTRAVLLCKLQHILGPVDRGRDRGDTDHIGVQRRHPAAQILIRDIVGHRVDEMDVVKAGAPQAARQIGNPGWRPCACDLGPARAVIGVNKQYPHDRLPELFRNSDTLSVNFN